jgi:hypothetical protein
MALASESRENFNVRSELEVVHVPGGLTPTLAPLGR